MEEFVQGKKLNSMADTVEIVTREMQINDFYKSLLAIWLTTHHDENYEEGKGASRGNIGNETGNSPGKHYGNNEQTVSQQETVE